MSTRSHISNIIFLEFWVFFLSLVASGHVQELLMHFHKITLYNVIAYCKRDDNHFYEWVISIFLIRFM
jgi:hypothetical protein